MDKNLILSFLIKNGINSKEIAEKFAKYINFLLLTNRKFNLVSFKDETEILEVHIRDSLEFLKAENFSFKDKLKLIDIGSGAGFPGIPLGIVMDSWQVILVESIRKKANFLNLAVKLINCSNIKIMNERAENLSKNNEFREKFDFASARWISKGSAPLDLLAPFVKKSGKIALWKDPKELQELNNSRIEKVHSYQVDNRTKYIIFINKI